MYSLCLNLKLHLLCNLQEVTKLCCQCFAPLRIVKTPIMAAWKVPQSSLWTILVVAGAWLHGMIMHCVLWLRGGCLVVYCMPTIVRVSCHMMLQVQPWAWHMEV